MGALLLLFATACQVTVTAEIDAEADGTGFVRAGVGLDAEAARATPQLADQLRVDDLRQSGWTVTGPRREDDGLLWIRASKPFSTPTRATEVMNELAGKDGPFRDLALRQERSLLKSRATFSGVVDLTQGMSMFVDPDLKAKLGDAFKVDEGAFTFAVAARLPGKTESWTPALGHKTVLLASSESWRLVPVVPATVALLCGAAAILLVVRRRRRAPRTRS